MTIKNIILSALLLVFVAGCKQGESSTTTTSTDTNAPVVTNAPVSTNK